MSTHQWFSERVRHEFESLQCDYFNAAYMGPLPKTTHAAILGQMARAANPSFMDYAWTEFPDHARSALGRLLGVPPESLSMHSSTSEVLSTLAAGLALESGDHVALCRGEYPSDVLPWMLHGERRGYGIHWAERGDLQQDPGAWVDSLPPSVRAIAVSHVCFQTGSIIDIEMLGRFTRPRGIFLVVDVTQSLGGMALPHKMYDVADVVVCSTYKWMLAPYGHAFAWWAPQSQLLVQRQQIGWMSMPQAPYNLTHYTTDARPGARKFDRGQAASPMVLAGLMASCQLLEECGLDKIHAWNQSLVSHFVGGLFGAGVNALPQGTGSNIVCLQVPGGQSSALQQKLRTHNVDASVREGNLRFSFHLFNTRDQVDRVLEALRTLV